MITPDLQTILDYFPDAVDVQLSAVKSVTEFAFDGAERVIELAELEPETGILVGMSSFSHRVYVYVDELF